VSAPDASNTAAATVRVAALARAVARTGRGVELTAANRAGRWRPVEELAAGGGAFYVTVDPEIFAVDCDVDGCDQRTRRARADAFDRLSAALTVVGVAHVVVRSGRCGHRHLFARAGTGPGRAELDAWARRHGLDVRHTIRPPGSPHRLGLPVTVSATSGDPEADLTGPAASAADRRRVLRAVGSRVLSQRMRRLLRDGHRAAGYRSASHGRMAFTVAAVACGLGPGWVRAVFDDPANELGVTWRSRSETWRNTELDRLFTKAGLWVAATGDRPGADHAGGVDTWAASLDAHTWSGMAGATDLAVAEALARLARSRGGTRFAGAVAEIAVGAGVHLATARRALRRLVDRGLLAVVEAPSATTATVWELRPPAGGDQPDGPVGFDEGSVGDLGADWARWGALGKSAVRVLRRLDPTPAPTAQVAATAGLSVNATRLHLRRLHRLGLATRTGAGWATGPAPVHASVTRFSVTAGTSGARDRQRDALARHRAERAACRARWRAARAAALAARADGDLEAWAEAVAGLPGHVVDQLRAPPAGARTAA
jgi:hypothetical protein